MIRSTLDFFKRLTLIVRENNLYVYDVNLRVYNESEGKWMHVSRIDFVPGPGDTVVMRVLNGDG